MSSKDDTYLKKAETLYKEIMGDNPEPNYAKFMSYAFKKQDEVLVKRFLHNGKEFESKEELIKILASHMEKHQEKTVSTTTTWADRVKSEKNNKDKPTKIPNK